MGYRNGVLASLVAAGVLAVLYAASFVFAPGRMEARGSVFSPLDARSLPSVARIELRSGATKTVLERREGAWKAARGGTEYPVKAKRVASLLSALSATAAFSLRSYTPAAHGALGLGEADASRLSVFGPEGKPLLDLLLGYPDAVGTGIHLRFADRDESFVARDRFSPYLTGGLRAWFDLSLFSCDPFTPDSVQRIVVGTGGRSYALARDADLGWILEGKRVRADPAKAEAYAAELASAEAYDFAPSDRGSFVAFITILIETGDGGVRKIVIGAIDGERLSVAAVSGAPHRFLVDEESVERLGRDESYFYDRAAMKDR